MTRSVLAVAFVLSMLFGCDLLDTPSLGRSRVSPTVEAQRAAREAAVADSTKAYNDSLAALRVADSTRTASTRRTWATDSANAAKAAKTLATNRSKDSAAILKTRAADSVIAAKHYKADSATFARDSIAGAKALAALNAKYATKMSKDTQAYNKARTTGATKLNKDSAALLAAQTTKYATKLAKDSAAVDAAQALVNAETDSTSAKLKAAHAAKLAKAKAALKKDLDAQTKAIATAQGQLTKDSAAYQSTLSSLSSKLAATPGVLAAQYAKDSATLANRLAKDRTKWATRKTDDSTKLVADVAKKTAKWAKDTVDMVTADSLARLKKTADSLSIVRADSVLVVRRGLVTFSPVAGNFTTSTSVTLASSYLGTAGANIYYTTDGSTPTTSSTRYTGAITVDTGMTITAIAVRTGYATTSPVGAKYCVGTTGTPTFSPAAGTYSGTQFVSVTTPDTATIYYTLNGSTPTTSSPSVVSFAGTIEVDSNQTLKVLAVRRGKAPAAIGSATYAIRVANPDISPEADSTALDSLIVTITCDDTLAAIHYTTDSTAPTASSRTISSGGTIRLLASHTVRAITTRAHFTSSDTVSVTGTIQMTAPVHSLAAGEIDTATAVDTITSTSTAKGASIYYTLNGSTPTNTVSSTNFLYTGPIRIHAAGTVNAIAYKPNTKASDVGSVDYTDPAPVGP